ncbi:FMRFamide receptor [Biomphalaria pfeifferi]|uniref:FMRFamide receptor n=1 Tax=Biomphalaria pfeifferi TaxID=112525 RepID=A0AAD8BLC6_BIOPF|nr:FMRFamide receptor [Biomphalaria pfeifferi]
MVIGLFSVMILTSLLVIHLRRQTKWRMKSSSYAKQQAAYSSRDRKSQALVIVVASSVVVCYIPLVCASLVSVFEQSSLLSEENIPVFLLTLGAQIFIFGMTNYSSNILIYYKMNDK